MNRFRFSGNCRVVGMDCWHLAWLSKMCGDVEWWMVGGRWWPEYLLEWRCPKAPTPKAVSEDERKPLPPDSLFGALQDRIHRDRCAVRAGKSLRNMTEEDFQEAHG